MLREALQSAIEAAVAALVREGRVPAAVAEAPVEISDTKSPDHGDYACNLAMVAAKRAGMNPRALGEMLRDALLAEDPTIDNRQSAIHNVDLAGPGFLNLRLRPEAVAAYVPNVIAQGEAFGHLKQTEPQRINVEFVSVNPNGPITIGSGRGAAFGSALANVLQAAGNVVHREYYINDGVNSEQMRLFAESVRALALDLAMPEKGYKGEYVGDVAAQARVDVQSWQSILLEGYNSLIDSYRSITKQANELADRVAEQNAEIQARKDKGELVGNELDEARQRLQENRKELSRLRHAGIDLDFESARLGDMLHGTPLKEAKDIFAAYGSNVIHLPVAAFQVISQDKMLRRQREDLDHFGVVFDTWFSEQSLHDRGIVLDRIDRLKTTGVADEEPYRTKLKLGKGGKVEETIREAQTDAIEDEGSEDEAPTPQQPTTHNAPANTLWLRSTKFGDDMDRVLRRRDGRLTYIASDVAYHEDKLNRPEGATKLITILGPDHHGYIGRLTAVMAALLRGADDTEASNAHALALAKERLEVVIYQLVRFLKDGKPAPMRKRDGNIYELRDLIDELGKSLNPDGTEDERRATGRDVARFFYLMRSHDTTMDFDIDLATRQSDENPVFYAQYAHARICSVLRKASEVPSSSPRGEALNDVTLPSGDGGSAEGGDARETTFAAGVASQVEGVGGGDLWNPTHIDYRLLTDSRETALIKKILDLPWEVGRVAEDYGVHRLATYAVELARAYHHFYDACRVVQPDRPALTRARLALCEATKVALHATFELLGVSSPERLDRRETLA